MARIRTFKPEFWDSPGIETLDFEWRLLYMAMWNLADDVGRGKSEPRELLGFAFPRDEVMTSADIRRGLGGIRRVFGVNFYKVSGRSYFAIPSWDKHQKIDKRAGSRYPGPDEGEPYDPETNTPADLQKPSNSWVFGGKSAGSPEVTPVPRRDDGAGTGEQGNRGTGEQILLVPENLGHTDADSEPRDDVARLCTHLRDRVLANGARATAVNITKGWTEEARKLLDRDKVSEDDAHKVIDWCQDDSFWSKNILSMPKFRDKYDQLRMKALESDSSSKKGLGGW